ncbi:methylenetetrahydrofolate reductase [NAD(P)H] [Oligoflexia bacterium]|nr:methylenetetrahydrofolate reductase [NAD(P)H] [Oligoflexia bacterium]
MKFAEIFRAKNKVFSLEFFPPKKDENLPATFELIQDLKKLAPDFMTVTYGAGGGTRSRTKEITAFIANEMEVISVAHLTCVGHTVAELDEVLDDLKSLGINHILALRGDPLEGDEHFTPHPQGFACARDLVAHISKRGDFSIAVAGYPEGHPEAVSLDKDIAYLKEKVDAGAELIMTQLFFDAAKYFEFVNRARAIGISVPIVPGVMPIRTVKQVQRFTSMCGASIPSDIQDVLTRLQDDAEAVKAYGIEKAIELCTALLAGGAPGIHLFTLNKSHQVEKVMQAIR